MPLKDYSTAIAVSRTLGEIQEMLARGGAERVMTLYERQILVGIEFLLPTPEGEQHYRLPANIPAVLAVLERDKQRNSRVQATPEQAARVGWRILRDWLAAQLALIETRMVTLDRVLLPYLVLEGGRTLYDAIAAHELPLALPPPSPT